MADEIELDYEYLAQRALRRVVYDALALTLELGRVPGRHHFYIEFATTAEGVEMPAELKAAYAERMTIVLQHQFEALTLDECKFGVTLRFKGRPSRLVIPFEAVTAFSDPGASFGLRFDAALGDGIADEAQRTATVLASAPASSAPKAPGDSVGGAEVVSLDKFRKK